MIESAGVSVSIRFSPARGNPLDDAANLPASHLATGSIPILRSQSKDCVCHASHIGPL